MPKGERMNIALFGYGRMGHDIEQVAKERGHAIPFCFDIDRPLTEAGKLPTGLKDVDCAIDFSAPAATVHHVRTLGPLHIPIVVGTTGWNEQLPAMLEFIRQCGGTLFYSSNFSIGANVFFQVAAEAAKFINRFPDYDIAVHEIHHRLKKDAPSGTALKLADVILRAVKRKTGIVSSLNNRAIEPHELLVSSSRVGSVPGTHSVTFESPVDSIQITHTAHSRRGFAEGAVNAAEWVRGKMGVFTMDNFLFDK